jgi:hypothetical protein
MMSRYKQNNPEPPGKPNIADLADAIIVDAMKPETKLETRIAALKAVALLHLGDSRIRAMLRAKGLFDGSDDPDVVDFNTIRDRVRAVE